ncbi:hypothetical protein EG329_001294 [Mollisiaceae sp. DMI_Dod_QoI]|nr:hypothetical protein EG329_001294 [Helotiales sp. DMI_Dod_QoI]
MSLSEINLAPPTLSDFLDISELVELSFAYQEFGLVAFGPKRFSPAGKEKRAKKMTEPLNPGETKYEMKAVTLLPDGTEEIVGFASWYICVGRGGSKEEKGRLGTREGWAKEEKEKEEKKDEKVEEGHGNPKIREDVLGGISKILASYTKGKDYVILQLLVVRPGYQRRGIGAMLFEDGLKVADQAGLQVVLGASDQGVGLYKKHGCIERGIMRTNLWEYEGGEGLGVATHSMLHRPARGKII